MFRYLGVLDGTPGVSSVFEVLLFGMGAASTCAAFAVIVWRIAKPHVARYVETLVRPIAAQVNQVQQEVKPDGGRSLHDQAHKAHKAASNADRKLDELHRDLTQIAVEVGRVQRTLDQHVGESRTYLEVSREILSGHGIHLPPTDDERPRE